MRRDQCTRRDHRVGPDAHAIADQRAEFLDAGIDDASCGGDADALVVPLVAIVGDDASGFVR